MTPRAPGGAPIALEVKNLTMDFGGLRALDDISITIAQGEIVAIIGPNGAARPPSSTASPASTSPRRGT